MLYYFLSCFRHALLVIGQKRSYLPKFKINIVQFVWKLLQQIKKPTKHGCCKNWDSTSTAMESDIIVEGFWKSMAMHNLIYHKLIGDRDSRDFKKLFCKPIWTV